MVHTDRSGEGGEHTPMVDGHEDGLLGAHGVVLSVDLGVRVVVASRVAKPADGLAVKVEGLRHAKDVEADSNAARE